MADEAPDSRHANTLARILLSSATTAGLVLLLSLSGSGCRLVKGAADLPGDAVRVVAPDKRDSKHPNVAELQAQLIRFTDQYVAEVVMAINELDSGDAAVDRTRTLEIRASYVSDLWMATTGPNTFANLLDLVTVTTLSRIVIEEYWIPEVYGDSAKPLLEAVRKAEKDIWAIAGNVLTKPQQEELRTAIKTWREENPDAVHAMHVRAVGLAGNIASASSTERDRPQSVFGLLMIDPLAGLDPATMELAQTRLAAERALFVAQRMPYMLRWQTELWSIHMAELPETKQIITNANRIAKAAVRVSRAAEELPNRISAERREILRDLLSEQHNLRGLSADIQNTLDSGSQLASNASVALTSFDSVVNRLEAMPSDPNAPPFRIQDYTRAAAQLDNTIQRLITLIEALDEKVGFTNLAQAPAQIRPVATNVRAEAETLVDHIYYRLLILLVMLVLGVMGAIILHARLRKRAAV